MDEHIDSPEGMSKKTFIIMLVIIVVLVLGGEIAFLIALSRL